jgi:hypothetical protein
VRYGIADVLYVIGDGLRGLGGFLVRLPRAVGSGATRFWGSLSVVARRRFVAAVGVAVVLIAILALAVPNLPCSFPGGDSCQPGDDAERLVPADALAYVHANLDPDTDQYATLATLVDRVPLFGGQVAARAAGLIPGPGGAAVDFDADIRPWFGGEAAFAVMPGSGGGATSVDLLEVADADAAAAFADRLAGSRGATEDYEGVEVTTGARGISSAQTNGFLVVGSGDAVREAIDTASGAEGAEPLADDQHAADVREQLPEQRFADAWISADGVAQLIAGGSGLLSTMTPLLAPGATTGAAASLSASGDAIEITVRSDLDPEQEGASPGFFDAFPGFEPKLPADLSADTLAYLGFGDPKSTAAALLSQATTEAPGIASGFEDLAKRLSEEGGVDLATQLAGALGEEAAVAIAPSSGTVAAATSTPEAAQPTLPYALFVASGVDEDGAREALGALQVQLANAVGTGSAGQAPVFGEQRIDGVDAHSLQVSPAVELTYAVFDGLAAVATNPAAIADLAGGDGGLDEDSTYQQATAGFGDKPSLLAYLDLAGLVEVGERSGLAEDPAYATFAGDFRSLDALGLEISNADGVLATDARLLLRENPGVAGATTTPAPTD